MSATAAGPLAHPAPRRAALGRVMVILAADAISGPGRQLAALAAALPERGIDVLVVVLQRAAPSERTYAAFLESAGVPFQVVRDHGPIDPRIVPAVRAIVERWRPDIIQTHGYKASAVGLLLRTGGCRQRWIGCYHGWTSEDAKARFYHRLDHWMLGRADRILVMSRTQQREFVRYGDRVRVVHNAIVPLAAAEPAAEAARVAALLREVPRPIIGVIGRLSPEKGVDVFLRACSLLHERGVRFGAAIVGDGPERAALDALAAHLQLNGIVRFTGSTVAMNAVYRGIDLLAIPSRSEGLPNVLLEALAADVPIVATAVGAIPEIVEHDGAARLVPPASPPALADAMADALATPRDDAAACAARADAARRVSLAHRVSTHVALYLELISAAAGTPALVGPRS
jgi:glycosyltransferase involved in cell wall biosynthesis